MGLAALGALVGLAAAGAFLAVVAFWVFLTSLAALKEKQQRRNLFIVAAGMILGITAWLIPRIKNNLEIT